MIPFLLMTGKGSSSSPVLFYWKEITLRGRCSAVFNGLIALEEAVSGNAVTAGAGGRGGVGRNITGRRYRQQEKVGELA